jgi:hypothetical protein
MARRDSDIDHLYQLPLEEFTAARAALAKEADRAEAARIRVLGKPTLPAWTVNQLYWIARPKYSALVDAAERLRSAHRAALAGKHVDLRGVDETHRRALNAALKEATAILERAGHPVTTSTVDALSRTLAALPVDGMAPGRLTRPLSPAGFELLAGVTPAARVLKMPERRAGPTEHGELRAAKGRDERQARKARAEAHARLRDLERETRQAERTASQADARVARARTALAAAEKEEAAVRATLDKAAARAEDARRALDEARRDSARAARALTDATAGRDAAERRFKDVSGDGRQHR